MLRCTAVQTQSKSVIRQVLRISNVPRVSELAFQRTTLVPSPKKSELILRNKVRDEQEVNVQRCENANTASEQVDHQTGRERLSAVLKEGLNEKPGQLTRPRRLVASCAVQSWQIHLWPVRCDQWLHDMARSHSPRRWDLPGRSTCIKFISPYVRGCVLRGAGSQRRFTAQDPSAGIIIAHR